MTSDWKDIKIQIMNILNSSSVDGTGFRDVLFVSGCPHRCEDCHNPETWDYDAGIQTTLGEVYDKLCQSSITNVTFSGGEPFEQSWALYHLALALKENTNKTIWIYSGYTYEQIVFDKEKRKLLELCDVLVDGKYEKDNTELNLRFKGSLNQRIIDIKASVKALKPVLFEMEF
ncbi:MAG: anaerobic ribonucleoside-triphosphate reductase activating protein [Clostridia bacterium]|nr:anaerobic ribonucleoside-triphosphate reductase activating protein [Clostridia bacterium]